MVVTRSNSKCPSLLTNNPSLVPTHILPSSVDIIIIISTEEIPNSSSILTIISFLLSYLYKPL